MSDAPQILSTNGSLFLQMGGPGNPLMFTIGPNSRGRVSAFAGGGVSVESLYSFFRPIGSRVTGNPARITGEIAGNHTLVSEIRDVMKTVRCGNSMHLIRGCPPADLYKFSQMYILVDWFATDLTQTGDLLDGITGETVDQMDTLSIDGLALIECRPLKHAKISDAVSTGAFNHGILISVPSCAGVCGAGDDGQQEFLAVGDPVSPATIPRIFYTANSGQSWTQQTIAAVANGAAEAVAVAGNRVIVAVSGTNAGVYTASLADVKVGTAVFTLANGITATHVYNDVVAIDSSTVVAVGASGRIAVSVDGGFNFTLVTSGVATTLNRVAAGADKNWVYIGGASGVVLRLKALAYVDAITITNLSTDGVTALAIPLDRTEVYVGSSTGEMFRSRNPLDPTPTWEDLIPTPVSGGSIIEDIRFAEARQQIMYVVQSNGSSQSRVIIDYSGGGMANAAMAVGTFTDPVNSVINSIAPASANYALTFGEPNTGQGFIGRLASNP